MCCSVCDSIALRGGGVRSADQSMRIDRRSADPDCYCCCFVPLLMLLLLLPLQIVLLLSLLLLPMLLILNYDGAINAANTDRVADSPERKSLVIIVVAVLVAADQFTAVVAALLVLVLVMLLSGTVADVINQTELEL